MADRIHKAQLVDMVAESLGCPKAQAARSVNAVLDSIGQALSENDRVTLTGFGTFEIRETAPRKIKLIAGPNAGQLVEVPAGKRVAFNAGSGLSDIVRSGRA